MYVDPTLDGWFSDIVKFKVFEGKKTVKDLVRNPTRLITGVDPASTKVWNLATGSRNKPLVDAWGGTTKETAAAAARAGINIRPGMALEAVAHMVAQFYAGAGLAKAVQGGDTLMTIATNLKKAADAQGGVGPSYQSAGEAVAAGSLPGDFYMPQAYNGLQPYAAATAPSHPVPHAELPAWVLPAVEQPQGVDPAVLDASLDALGRADCAWARDAVLDFLAQATAAPAPGTKSAARALAAIGDHAAIPRMIEMVLRDRSGELAYDVGYFGLAELTGVKWQERYDGAWWADWWQKNRARFPEGIAVLEVRR